MNMEFDIVSLIYSWRVEDARKRIEKKLENEIYVTDLIYCPLKYYFQRIYKEIALAEGFNPVTIYGEAVHIGIEEVLKRIFGSDNVKTEVEFEKEFGVEGKVFIVRGRVDAIVGNYIIEIKSGRSDANIPHQHHVLQARLYLWLTGLKKAILLYITPNRVSQYIVTEPSSDGEVSDLIRSLLMRSPAPRYNWECLHCSYAILCPSKRTSAV
jgi:CRISPR-associated exonuclease Cas4